MKRDRDEELIRAIRSEIDGGRPLEEIVLSRVRELTEENSKLAARVAELTADNEELNKALLRIIETAI